MFTGLIEETARVLALHPGTGGTTRLELAASRVCEGTQVGDSIAVNGCCLTVARLEEGGRLSFDLLEETLARTSLGGVHPGSVVNLERALAANARLGGHFVQGHVDATGEVLAIGAEPGGDFRVEIALPEAFARYVVFKGSIAIDGISLTVAELGTESFSVCIIPHTRAATNLGTLERGERVNLEFDLLAKYLERLTAAR